jgi:hypothetical protein
MFNNKRSKNNEDKYVETCNFVNKCKEIADFSEEFIKTFDGPSSLTTEREYDLQAASASQIIDFVDNIDKYSEIEGHPMLTRDFAEDLIVSVPQTVFMVLSEGGEIKVLCAFTTWYRMDVIDIQLITAYEPRKGWASTIIKEICIRSFKKGFRYVAAKTLDYDKKTRPSFDMFTKLGFEPTNTMRPDDTMIDKWNKMLIEKDGPFSKKMAEQPYVPLVLKGALQLGSTEQLKYTVYLDLWEKYGWPSFESESLNFKEHKFDMKTLSEIHGGLCLGACMHITTPALIHIYDEFFQQLAKFKLNNIPDPRRRTGFLYKDYPKTSTTSSIREPDLQLEDISARTLDERDSKEWADHIRTLFLSYSAILNIVENPLLYEINEGVAQNILMGFRTNLILDLSLACMSTFQSGLFFAVVFDLNQHDRNINIVNPNEYTGDYANKMKTQVLFCAHTLRNRGQRKFPNPILLGSSLDDPFYDDVKFHQYYDIINGIVSSWSPRYDLFDNGIYYEYFSILPPTGIESIDQLTYGEEDDKQFIRKRFLLTLRLQSWMCGTPERPEGTIKYILNHRLRPVFYNPGERIQMYTRTFSTPIIYHRMENGPIPADLFVKAEKIDEFKRFQEETRDLEEILYKSLGESRGQKIFSDIIPWSLVKKMPKIEGKQSETELVEFVKLKPSILLFYKNLKIMLRYVFLPDEYNRFVFFYRQYNEVSPGVIGKKYKENGRKEEKEKYTPSSSLTKSLSDSLAVLVI